jgi:hypothetical protein
VACSHRTPTTNRASTVASYDRGAYGDEYSSPPNPGECVYLHFFFIYRLLTLSPPTLEIHHQLQAVEALHAPIRLTDRWCFPSLLGVRPSGNRRSFQHLRHPRQLRLVPLGHCQRLVASSFCPLVIKVSRPSHIVVWEGSVWGALVRCPAAGRLPSDRACTQWSQDLSSSGSLQQVCSF